MSTSQDPLSDKEFKDHVIKEHRISRFSVYLKEIVYGGTDGIITTFAVVAGFSGAQALTSDLTLPIVTVLLFGFANLFADAASMGLGNFLSVRADQDVYKKEMKKEKREIKDNPEFELAETIHMLQNKGFTLEQSRTLGSIFSTNKSYWLEFMMKEELQMESPLDTNPFLTAFATSAAFMFFGSIPLLPYVFLGSPSSHIFAISIGCTLLALIGVGYLRWVVAKQGFFRSIGETVLLGSVSAGIAYTVGSFFRI